MKYLFFPMKYYRFGILLTFFSLWLTVYFTEALQEGVALFLIFSLGILHGSNDLLLIDSVNKKKTSKRGSLLVFITTYIITVIIAASLFYFIPVLALIAFIIFSAFHFGEQHWHEILKTNNVFNFIYTTSYGLIVLLLLFTLNSDQTIAVIKELTGYAPTLQWFLYPLLFCAALWVLLTGYLRFQKLITNTQLLFELFLLLVFTVVFNTATLIWAFAIYFIYWHSVPSIIEQLLFLYQEASTRTLFKYIKSSFPIWFISIKEETILIPLLFAFLGAITFAHSFIISIMFRLKK